MTITTMEELEAVPPNGIVSVDNNEWIRTEAGLKRMEVTLPLAFFEGRMNAGTVVNRDTQPPQPDQWWAGSTRVYYLTEVTERRVHYVAFRNGNLINTSGTSSLSTWTSSGTLHRLTGAPSELANSGVATLVTVLAETQRETRRAQVEVTAARTEVAAARAEVAAARTTIADLSARRNQKPDAVRQAVIEIRNSLDQIVQLMEE
jgi:hypothetical protein